MANPHPLFKALYHVKTATPSLLWSNLPLTTRSRSHTLTSSMPTLVTTPFAQNTGPHPFRPLPHPDRNRLVLTASWHNYTTLELIAHLHSLPPHLPPELLFPVLSSLVRVDGVGHSGLVWVPIIRTRPSMSCSNAPLYHPLAVASLEAVPLTLMSLARLMAEFLLAISNAPPTVSYALCPPDRTLLDW